MFPLRTVTTQEEKSVARSRYAALPRRRGLLQLLAASLVGGTAVRVLAQKFPSRAVRIVVGSPPGALGDVLARVIGQQLTELTNQPAIVENRPGAAIAIAAEVVAKSPGDGHTLLLAPDAAFVVNPFIYPKLPYDPARDFQPVALLGRASLVLLASPTLQVKTFDDFARRAKDRPKAINYGSGGVGHPTHIIMELVCDRTGIQLTNVPYSGTTPALQGLMRGDILAMISGFAEAMPQIRAGAVVPLAPSGPAAKDTFPTLPELKDLHSDLDVSVWFGVFAPAATPREVVLTLNAEFNKALAQPDVRKRFSDFGLIPEPGTPAEFEKLIKQDRERYEPLVKALRIVVE